MNGAKRRICVFCIVTTYAVLALVSIFSFGSAYGAVTASGTQTPGNPVFLNGTISYSLTISNIKDGKNSFINISVHVNGINISSAFSSTDCSLDGRFYCGRLDDGLSQTYTLSWTPPSAGLYDLKFGINCSVECEGSVLFSSKIIDNYRDTPRLTENETRLAISFDNACSSLDSRNTTGTPSKLLEACQSLDGADSATVLTALQQMTPSQSMAQGRSSLDISSTQSGNINARMSALRSGSVGANASGLRMSIQGRSLPVSVFSEMFNNGFNGFSDTDSPEMPMLYGPLGVFVNGNISIGDREASNNEASYDFSTDGLTVGADYRLNKKVVAGVALGYVNHETEYGSARGEMDVRGYSLSFFGLYYKSSQTYWDAIASIGKNRFDSQRNIQYGFISEQAMGSTSSLEFSLGLGGGYDYNQDGFTFGTYGRVNLVHADIAAYKENSNSGFELSYDRQSVTSLTTVFGGQASVAMSTRYGILSPQLRFEWIHEFQDESRYLTASFVNDPGSSRFKIEVDASDKNFWNVGTGIAATFSEGRSAFFYIDTILGKDNTTQNTYSVGFRMDY